MKDMVDVCGGRYKDIDEAIREIRHYMSKKPSHLIVEFNKTTEDQRMTIWMTGPDFKRTC